MSLLTVIALGCSVFLIGFMGVLRHRYNLIGMLLSLELMMLGVTINFVAFAYFGHSLEGQVVSLFILAVAAAESAVGLAIFIVYTRHQPELGRPTPMVLKG